MRNEKNIVEIINDVNVFHHENTRAIFLTPRFYLLPYIKNYKELVNIKKVQLKEIVGNSDTLNFDIITIIRLGRDAYYSPYENYFTPNATLIDYHWELCGPKLRNMIRRKVKELYNKSIGNINNDGGNDKNIRVGKYPGLGEVTTNCTIPNISQIAILGYISKRVPVERGSITLEELCRSYSLGRAVKLYPLTRSIISIADPSVILYTNQDTNESLIFTCWGLERCNGITSDTITIDSKLHVSTMEYGTTYLVYDVESDRAVVFAATIDCIHKSLVDKYLSYEKAASRPGYCKGTIIHLDSEGIPPNGIEVLKQRYKTGFLNIYKLPPNSEPIQDRSVLQYTNYRENLYIYASERATGSGNLEILTPNNNAVKGGLEFIIPGDYLAVDFANATAISFKVNYS
jgi:hypothetical protein